MDSLQRTLGQWIFDQFQVLRPPLVSWQRGQHAHTGVILCVGDVIVSSDWMNNVIYLFIDKIHRQGTAVKSVVGDHLIEVALISDDNEVIFKNRVKDTCVGIFISISVSIGDPCSIKHQMETVHTEGGAFDQLRRQSLVFNQFYELDDRLNQSCSFEKRVIFDYGMGQGAQWGMVIEIGDVRDDGVVVV